MEVGGRIVNKFEIGVLIVGVIGLDVNLNGCWFWVELRLGIIKEWGDRMRCNDLFTGTRPFQLD